MENRKVFYLYGNALIRIKLENDLINTILNEEIIIDKATKKAIYFSYKQQIGDSELKIIGVDRDNKLMLRTETGGNIQYFELEGDYVPLASAGFLMWQEGIKEGKKSKFKVFVEALQKKEDLTIEVGRPRFVEGKKIYPLKQKLGNIEVESEVLENGDIFREESIQGFTMKKITKEEALKFDGELSLYDMLSYSLIPIDKPITGYVKEIEIILRGADKFNIPETDFQKVLKKIIIID